MSTDTKYPYCNPEIWGGIECTINRLDNRYRDQLLLTGHYDRTGDIERFAALGISKLRYPVLWEHHEPVQGQKIDWSWSDHQLETIRTNKIFPIIGLLHHGSGPSFTDLLDEKFPEKLAAYAKQVAMRYPWVKLYTPVNEPLTTARFSGLYGHWYPHHRSEKIFIEMLLNQLKGIVLSMQAICQINPEAELVQTEDLSKTHSTPVLKYQAAFENKRRWLTYDILCGRFDKRHFFWNYFIEAGIDETKLAFFIENRFAPSVLGFNYYVTSERFLDNRTEQYPACMAGGNGRHLYVDTEAVQKRSCDGAAALLKEAWQRYHMPIAITECHLSCTREEQMRWLKEVWDNCCSLKKKGVDIRAVTAWSLLGACDWNSLLTLENNHYEAGVFDVANGRIRPTSLAAMIKSFSKTGVYNHPLLSQEGWWRRNNNPGSILHKGPPLLIIGKTGTLGNMFIRTCVMRGIHYTGIGKEEMNIMDESSIRNCIDRYKPWAIINATGYVKVDDAEEHQDECFAVNVKFPALLAGICKESGIRLMSFSSDLVFNGDKRVPYLEEDDVYPLNVYGRSKAECERQVLQQNPETLVIRTSAFFSPWDKYNFVYSVLECLEQKRDLCMPKDVTVSPTYVPDLCQYALDLFIDEESGIWHLSNDGMASWYALGRIIAERKGISGHGLIAKSLSEMNWKASRPLYSVLQSDKGVRLPHFENALDRYFEQSRI